MFKRFWKDESGGSAAEYALIIAVVGPGIGAAALVLGANVKQSGGSLDTELDSTNAVAAVSSNGNNGGGQGLDSGSADGTPVNQETVAQEPVTTDNPGNSHTNPKPCNPNKPGCS
ncbi:Flp family type IVb pilin [Croceicoccus bisphenolivorans]|uniref:Flp family type IVb pilin n=1 Tax=Croceicoccus bisphenolivorans TaxID=1783232 RepID=UPI00082E3943